MSEIPRERHFFVPPRHCTVCGREHTHLEDLQRAVRRGAWAVVLTAPLTYHPHADPFWRARARVAAVPGPGAVEHPRLSDP